ncbi:MAG: hypothetical protein V3U02_02780 [Calditrichia bacterium]
MPISYKQWMVAVKACGSLFLWSTELKEFNGAFKIYDLSKRDGPKEDAYEKFLKWRDCKNSKCVKEREKLGKDILKQLESTVYIKMVKKGTLKYIQQPAAIKNGIYTGFRGDNRGTDEIAIEGFDIRGGAKTNLSRCGGIAGWFEQKIFTKYGESADFARYCIAEKDMSRPTVATSLDEGCGGYSSGTIYKFKFDNLKEYTMSMSALTLDGAMPWKLPLKMYLEKHTDNIKNSKIVGINLNVETYEVVFLNKIEPENIVEYYDKVNKKWVKMPS